ncbi:MAG TPA: hypothetical protein VEF04_09345, partial [Blastocatellia bacterium]|nr:hypothetical protein [Blastocatellia bacterium]
QYGGGVPCVIDISMCTVYYRCSPYPSRQEWVIVDRRSHRQPMFDVLPPPLPSVSKSDFSDSIGNHPIRDVLVFCSSPPACDGTIRSKTSVLLPLIESHIRSRCAEAALAERVSNPEVLIQDVVDGSMRGMIKSPDGKQTMETARREATLREARAHYVHANGLLHRFMMELDRYGSRTTDTLKAGAGDIGAVKIIELPFGKQLAHVVNRTTNYDAEARVATLQSEIGSVLGVPRSMFEPAGANRVTVSEANFETFQRTQTAYKQFVVPILETMACKIWFKLVYQMVLAETRASPGLSVSSAAQRYRPRVDLTAVPPMGETKELYREGYLKYEALKRQFVMYYCMKEDDFEDEPREPVEAQTARSLQDDKLKAQAKMQKEKTEAQLVAKKKQAKKK